MTRMIVYLSAIVWLACVVGSLFALNVAPDGDGFLRGFNRVEGFLTWQFAALGVGIIGIIALRLTPAPHSRVLKILGYGPIAASALLAIVLAGTVAWAAFSPTPPPTPADALPPTTTPPSSPGD